jgi:hypothetical protein
MRECCRRPAAERQTKMMDDGLEPLGPSPVTSQDAVLEMFAENATTTKDSIAPKTSRQHRQFDASAPERQVRGPPQISALDASARSPAIRAGRSRGSRSQEDMNDLIDNLD